MMDTSHINSAWKGHERFAWWLVRLLDPKVTLDLGVDEAYSTIELARFNKGTVFGIDWFQGDAQTGWADKEAIARKNVEESGYDIVLIKDTFENALKDFKDGIVDLAHIDGFHAYKSAKKDFDLVFPKVRSGGVILFHDVWSFPNDSGRVFHELALPKFDFPHSAGLGVVLKP